MTPRLPLLVLIMGLISTLSAQWHYHNPLPQGNNLRDVYFLNSTNGLAVGDAGTLLRTEDGGATWELGTVPTYEDLYAITFVGEHIGFICGSNGTILHSADGGFNWEKASSGTTVNLRDIHFSGSPRGLVVGDGGTILITYDGGVTWSARNSNTTANLQSLFCLNALEVIATGDEGTIIYSFNGGAQWHSQESGTTESLNKILFTSEQTGWITGASGIILKTVNTGETWRPQESGVSASLQGMCMIDDHTGWIAGQSGTILKTSDGGVHWSQQLSNSNNGLNAICTVNDQNCFVVGDNGEQKLTADGGLTWVSKSNGFYEPGSLRFAGFTDDLHGWACDWESQIIHTSDGGINWSGIGSNPGDMDIVFTNQQQGWCVTYGDINNALLVTHDGGISWDTNYYNADGYEGYNSIYFISPDTGWVGGVIKVPNALAWTNKYLVLKTTNGGETWSRQIVSQPMMESYWTQVFDLFFSDDMHGWAIGTSYGLSWNQEEYWKIEILKTDDGGNSWSLQSTDLPPYSWWYDSKIYFINNMGYAISCAGDNYISFDGGLNWSESNHGINLTDVFFTEPEEGWAVGSGGIIMHTLDGGLNWKQEMSPSKSYLYSIVFTDNGDGWIFGANSTILHWEDNNMVSAKEPGIREPIFVTAYPNPCSTTASISYELKNDGFVSVMIFSNSGQLITELFNGPQSTGNHTAKWDASSQPTGVYYYRISGNGNQQPFMGKLLVAR